MRARAVLLILACAAVPEQGLAAACPDRSPQRHAYFGDLHIHTGLSADAMIFGTTNRPDDAYRFARGQAITVRQLSTPLPPIEARLPRPLDKRHSRYRRQLRDTTDRTPLREPTRRRCGRRRRRERALEEVGGAGAERARARVVTVRADEDPCADGRDRNAEPVALSRCGVEEAPEKGAAGPVEEVGGAGAGRSCVVEERTDEDVCAEARH